jgi:hypothetical protein
VSTVAEPKHIDAVLIDVSAYQGDIIEGWIGTNRILEIPDFVFSTRLAFGGANAYAATAKISRIPVDMILPVGQIFKIAVRSGGVAITIDGAYEYQISNA